MLPLSHPTFPHPGGPQRIRDGISWEFRSDRKSVCWPTTLLWPKYSSSVFGLSISAKGLSIASSIRGDKSFDVFKVCPFDPEVWLFEVSVPAGPGSASLSRVRLIPLLTAVAAVCLLESDTLRSFRAEALLLLAWNREKTAGDGVAAEEEEEEEELATALLTAGGGASALMRVFFSGGSLSSAVDGLLSVTVFNRHTSRCPLIVAGLKSFKQTGHCTESRAVDVISLAMLIPAKLLTFNHVTKHCFEMNCWEVVFA